MPDSQRLRLLGVLMLLTLGAAGLPRGDRPEARRLVRLLAAADNVVHGTVVVGSQTAERAILPAQDLAESIVRAPSRTRTIEGRSLLNGHPIVVEIPLDTLAGAELPPPGKEVLLFYAWKGDRNVPCARDAVYRVDRSDSGRIVRGGGTRAAIARDETLERLTGRIAKVASAR